MSTLTYDEIAKEAQHLWQQWGCPADRDTEIWLEAERKLKEDTEHHRFATRTSAEAASESEVENLLSPAQSEQMSIQTAMQREEPRGSHRTGSKNKHAETDKPLRSRPHSS